MEENKVKNIELRSEEVQEVMGAVPHWILRWGIILFSLIILILLIGCWFFKYPDTITATMTLTGTTPSATIISKSSGTITELYVHDKQLVEKNEYLAVIENPASIEDLKWLKTYLNELEIGLLDNSSMVNTPPILKKLTLGNIQSSYSSFMRILNNYQKFIELNYYPQKISSIRHRTEQYQQYARGMERQHLITRQQYQIAEQQYMRDSLLRQRNVLSLQDMDNARNQYLQSRLSYENSTSSLENLQMQISQMQESLLDIEQQYQDSKNSLESELTTATIQLTNDINTWEMTYVLTSPIKGQITFTNYWSTNQNVAVGEIVFTIVPDEKTELLGKALLPINRSGKVKIGQTVNVHFLNFPDEEFGMVRGIVQNISLVPIRDNYIVEICFPNGLTTSYKKELPFTQEMTANIEIITEDLRLLERFFLPLKKIFKEYL